MKTVIQGTGKSNRLLLISGLHGNEYTPLVVLSELIKGEFFESILNQYETITILEYTNIHGIINNVREFEGNNDLNRIFKENYIVNDLKTLINESTHIIDIHSSPNCIDMALINQNEYANSYVEFCIKYKIPYTLWESGSRDAIKQHSIENNKICFTIECNGIGRVDFNSAKNTIKIIKAILKNLTKLVVKNEPAKYESEYRIYSDISGVFYNDGDVGYILDIDTGKKTVIQLKKSQEDTICSLTTGYAKSGSPLAIVQPLNSLQKK